MNDYLWLGFEDELEKLASLKSLAKGIGKLIRKKAPRTYREASNIGKSLKGSVKNRLRNLQNMYDRADNIMDRNPKNFAKQMIGTAGAYERTFKQAKGLMADTYKTYKKNAPKVKGALKKDLFG